jgi:hypothetical protein
MGAAVSDKMECPGCGAVSSSVLIRVTNGDPCPFCGLSAHAVLEIGGVRRRQADEQLKEQLAEALVELDRVKSEAEKLRRQVAAARQALGCEYPHAPHDALKEPRP